MHPVLFAPGEMPAIPVTFVTPETWKVHQAALDGHARHELSRHGCCRSQRCKYSCRNHGHFRCFGVGRYVLGSLQHAVKKSRIQPGGAKIWIAQDATKNPLSVTTYTSGLVTGVQTGDDGTVSVIINGQPVNVTTVHEADLSSSMVSALNTSSSSSN